jgi:hypothetical protein
VRIPARADGPCPRCGLSYPKNCPYCGAKITWLFEPGATGEEGQFVAPCHKCKKWLEMAAPPEEWEGRDPLYQNYQAEKHRAEEE